MLQTEHPGPTSTHELHLLVEMQDGRVSIEQVIAKLSDALAWVEGVGAVEVYNKGAIRVESPDDAAYGHGV